MADAGLATKLDVLGTGDAPPSGISVDAMVVGVAPGDFGTGHAAGNTDLAASTDSGDMAVAAAVATGRLLTFASRNTGDSIPLEFVSGTIAGSETGAAGLAMNIVSGASATLDFGGIGGGGGGSIAPGSAPIFARTVSADGPASSSPSSTGVANTESGAAAALVAGSGLIINLVYDANALAAPASFRTAMQTAADMLEAAIFDNITVNITVGYGEFNGTPLPSGVAEGGPAALTEETYPHLRALLASHETSAADSTSVNVLPNTTTLNGQSLFFIGTAEAKALGAVSATNPAIDGNTGFATDISSSFLVGVALHEFTHAMGRASGDSGLSLFRYTSPGVHDFSNNIPTSASYFSIDGGVTKLADFGTNSDPSDFLNPPASSLTPNDPFNEIYGPGTLQSLTAVDLVTMDVLGFNVTGGRVVSSGTILTISSGQTSAGVTVLSGGALIVASGGTASNTLDEGREDVSGGTDVGGTVSGGFQYVFSGGNATGTTVTASGTVLGAAQYVKSGGTASGAAVNGGGFQAVYGGSATGTTVTSGGGQYVASGGTASGTIVSSGGMQDVFSAGTARGTTISQGGSEIVSSGGLAIGTAIYSGGTEKVFSGGAVTSTTVSGGGRQAAFAGGVLSGATVRSGGNQIVSSGGTASGTVLSGGGQIVSSGGTTNGTIVDSGGNEYVYGTAIGGLVNRGGIARVYGTASGGTVNSGGREVAFAGGVLSGATVRSGGNQIVSSGGAASGTLLSGGNEIVSSGGTASGMIVDSGGNEYVYGTARSGTVNSGGIERVYGTASGGAINSGGRQVAVAGGVLSGATVRSGGNQIVSSGGTASGTVLSGGGQIVSSGGTASGTIVDSGGIEYVYGTARGGPVNSGGIERVYGIASGGTVNSGGREVAFTGGVVSGSTVQSGGNQIVSSGGTASGTMLSGGSQIVSSGGTASGTIIAGGGNEYVYGTARGGAVNSGGTERVYGTASGGTVNSGGLLIVSAGGVASGVTINGGVVEVAGGGSIGGTSGVITFASGGTLQLDASVLFVGAIAGFATPDLLDQLDLRDIVFGPGTTPTESFTEAHNKTSGTLTVSDGTHSATLRLIGTYVTSQFQLGSDGHGGTLVTDPPVVAGGASQMNAVAQDLSPLTFDDLAPAQSASGATAPGTAPAGAVGAVDQAYAGSGQTPLPVGDPGGGSILPMADSDNHNFLAPALS